MCSSDTQSPRGVFAAEVVENRQLCKEHYRVVLRLESFPTTTAGQFVQIQCRPVGEQTAYVEHDWPDGDGKPPKFEQPELADKQPLLRRPFSLAGRRDVAGGVELDVIYRVVGAGTSWLADVPAGAAVSILGPLGNAFPISPTKAHAALVGGGVGIPPMLYLSRALQADGKQAVGFMGVRQRELLPLAPGPEAPRRDAEPTLCAAEFAETGTPTVIASDDDSIGFHGLVTDALLAWIAESGVATDDLVVYTCGPEPMMRAVADLCLLRDIECHVSMERSMACGMGTCQSCVVRVRADNEAGWAYNLCCKDGPVFPADRLLWD